MTYYIATASDWAWIDNEGGAAHPIIVEADNIEAAMLQIVALAVQELEGGMGGCDFKIAEIGPTIGVFDYAVDDEVLSISPFTKFED